MNNIEAQVRDLASAVLDTPIADDATRVETPQWDSLKHVELIFVIEDAFSIQFEKDELDKLDSISSIVSAITKHQG